jgi:hypothetical protein
LVSDHAHRRRTVATCIRNLQQTNRHMDPLRTRGYSAILGLPQDTPPQLNMKHRLGQKNAGAVFRGKN